MLFCCLLPEVWLFLLEGEGSPGTQDHNGLHEFVHPPLVLYERDTKAAGNSRGLQNHKVSTLDSI